MILRRIDTFLNSITMYRLVLYGLMVLAVISTVFGFIGLLPYSGVQLAGSSLFLIAVCYVGNHLFARVFGAQTNVESVYITALILFFVLSSIQSMSDATFVAGAGILAMASKYLMAIHKKHVFNPAAISVFLLGLVGVGSGSWWVSNVVLLPFVAIIGLLFVRKIRRFHLFFAFLAVATVVVTFVNMNNNMNLEKAIIQVFAAWPTVFFGTVMLTEPLTTPPTTRLQMMYGALVGLLFGIQFSYGPLYSSPEFALVVGNIFSYLVSPKRKLFLKLKDKVRLTPDMWEYVFSRDKSFVFTPGQYMEWTLGYLHPDTRGNRRYFTIASSPTDTDMKLGVKISPSGSSSFKKKLTELKKDDTVIASQLAGDFVLPEDADKKLVFLAGGIGITPFRSMVQYLLHTGRRRDVVLFYAAPSPDELAYKQFFDDAAEKTGVKPIYACTKPENAPKNWTGKIGRVSAETIKETLPDYKDRTYYLSGPIGMVDAYKEMLRELGIPKNHIVTDYFPGF